MAVQLNGVTSRWYEWNPDAYDPNTIQVQSEHWLRWGKKMYNGAPQSGYAIRGEAPPILTLIPGQIIRLARLRHLNNVISEDGLPLTYAWLELGFEFKGYPTFYWNIKFNHNETPNSTGDNWVDRDFVTMEADLPAIVEFEDARVTLAILGFMTPGGVLTTTFESAERSTNTVYIVAQVIEAEPQLIECVDDHDSISVFSPENCVVPCVAPITDLPFIEDCEIPDPPTGMSDCAAIDIPAVKAMGGGGIGGIGGAVGGDVLRITTSSQVEFVNDPALVTVIVQSWKVTLTHWHIHFIFRLYNPDAGVFVGGCCWWVWCPCPGQAGVQPSVDPNCPKTDTSISSPGYWKLIASKSDLGCGDLDPPPTVGQYYGQVEIECSCNSETSWTDPEPANPVVPDLAEMPDTLYLQLSGCPALDGQVTAIDRDDDGVWRGELSVGTATYKFSFQYVGDFMGASYQWIFSIYDHRVEDPYDLYMEDRILTSSMYCYHFQSAEAFNLLPFGWRSHNINDMDCCLAYSDIGFRVEIADNEEFDYTETPIS